MTDTTSRAVDPVAVVREYYDIVDGLSSRDLRALFADDVEVYFPKFGTGRGHEALAAIGSGFPHLVRSMSHDRAGLRIRRAEDAVVVEGRSSGETVDGARWGGDDPIGGRFCSVFEVRDGVIHRMHVYLDPDYGNATADRYPWHRDPALPTS